MEWEKEKLDEGYLIRIFGDVPTAVIVSDGASERIYLPGERTSDSSYYVSTNRETGANEFFHPGEIDDLEVLRTSS